MLQFDEPNDETMRPPEEFYGYSGGINSTSTQDVNDNFGDGIHTYLVEVTSEMENPSESLTHLELGRYESLMETKGQLERDLNLENLELSFDDLNLQVASLLKKSKGDYGNNKDIKRRQRKTPEQVKMMEVEYAKNPNWTRDYIKRLAKYVGLREG